MHLRLIWAVARKDILDLWKNKATMGGLLFPIFLSLLYLLIGKMVGNRVTNMLIYNPDNSGVARVVEAVFPNTQVTEADSAAQVASAFPEGEDKADYPYAIGLVVPADFEDRLRTGLKPQMELYFDGKTVEVQTQALIQSSILSYCQAITDPQPAAEITTTVVNPSPKRNVRVEIAKIYIPLALLVSLVVGTTFMPQLLIEEKEKKTLRMLMVSPASFEDVLFGKLLVVLAYQLLLTGVVLAIQNAFTGQVALVVLYAVLGGLFSVSLGLLIGSLFNTVSAASAVEGLVMLIYIIGGLFVGPLGELTSSGPVTRLTKLLPTYYLAEGVSNASQNLGSPGSHLLDTGVVLGTIIILLAVSAWVLRRQSAVAAVI